jgi:hypothetical protein
MHIQIVKEWMKKTVRPNENKLRVTQGALEREAALFLRAYMCSCGKVLHFVSLAPPAMAKRIFSLFYMRSVNPFIRSIYTYWRQGLISVIVLFIKIKAYLQASLRN